MTHQKTERGQALILIVFSIIGLIGITALAVDGGNAYLEKRRAQNAADVTALGGALARIKGGDWEAQTYLIAKQSGFDNNGSTNTVQVDSPPVSGKYAGNIEYIQVRITSHLKTYFAPVIGIRELTIFSEAVSRTKTPEITQILNGNALISLAPTSDCQKNPSFWVHGESTLSITGGGIFINSSDPACALIQNGNGSIRINDKGFFISMVGGASIQKPKLLTPYPPQAGGISIAYPPPFFMPKVGCSKEATVSEDGESMSPGAWGDVFPPAGVHKLESGVYCLDDDFIVNGGDTLEGHGVVFKLENGDLRWNGDATLDLRAPTGGDFEGLLIYVPMDNKARIVLTGSADSSITGTILAPAAEIHLNGGDSQHGYHSQIIGYRIVSDGQSNIVIQYDDAENYDTFNMPEVQLTQ